MILAKLESPGDYDAKYRLVQQMLAKAKLHPRLRYVFDVSEKPHGAFVSDDAEVQAAFPTLEVDSDLEVTETPQLPRRTLNGTADEGTTAGTTP